MLSVMFMHSGSRKKTRTYKCWCMSREVCFRKSNFSFAPRKQRPFVIALNVFTSCQVVNSQGLCFVVLCAYIRNKILCCVHTFATKYFFFEVSQPQQVQSDCPVSQYLAAHSNLCNPFQQLNFFPSASRRLLNEKHEVCAPENAVQVPTLQFTQVSVELSVPLWLR